MVVITNLTRIYRYTTKDFNRQVKNNIEKFDEDFMFQLEDDEYENLRFKNFTSRLNSNYGGRRYNPYCFTEQGIYMLMTVLKGEKATQQSKVLIRIFKKMKDYLIDNNLLELNNISSMLLKHDNEIKILQETFNKIEVKEIKNKIFFNGEYFDSYLDILKILYKSKKEIIIIDNYADTTLLEIISKIDKDITLITSKKLLKDIDIKQYNKQYHNLIVIKNNDFHDRFIILDKEKIYHIGSSINHLGNKIFGINIIEEPMFKQLLIDKINTII